MRARGLIRAAAGLQASLLFAMLLLPALTAAATIQTDLWIYQDGDTVTVSGVEFGPNEVVDFVTTDPEGTVVDTGSATTDDAGGVTYPFVLHVTVGGIYDVVGVGRNSGLAASTQFDPPAPTASPTTINFGSVFVGSSGGPVTVTVSNAAGATSLNINAVVSSSAAFTVDTSGMAGNLAGGASTTFTVSFTPSVSGAASGTITVKTNASADPTVAVSGSGIATDTTAPTVIVDAVSDSLLNAAEASTDVTWHADENGAYSVRVGGTSCSTGTQVASGSYATSPATVVTNVLKSALVEGANTIRVCLTDGAANTGSATTGVTVDTIAPTISIGHTADGDDGWNVSDAVAEAITAADGPGSGVATITCVDTLLGLGAATGAEPTYTADVTGEGAHGLSCTATDAAGNASSPDLDTVKIDTIDPSASLAVSAGTLGDNGWYVDDVTVSTSGSDATSGLASCTVDQHQTTDTTGTAFNGSCTDNAGNVGDAVALDVKRDATDPSAAVTPDRPADHLGWYNAPVTFATNGTDATSDIASCTADQPYTGPDGAGLTVPGTCTDNAGNSTTVDSAGFDFDDTDPVTTFVSRDPEPNAYGWANAAVTLTWSCADATSGPVSTPVVHTVSTDGFDQSSSATCEDVAGNTSSDTQAAISIDGVDPVISFLGQTPAENLNGWNKTPVTLDWSCSDALSGEVDAAVQTILGEGEDQQATATCYDRADNSAADTQLDIDIDLTDPIITFVSRTAANANGWNNTAVTVTWSCSDALSGAVSATVSDTISADGENQTASATCTDLAGNSASDSFHGISIDSVAPHDVGGTPSRAPDHNGWYNAALDVDFSGVDELSGIDECDLDVSYSGPDSTTASVSGSCTDQAGNSTPATFAFMYDGTAPDVTVTPDRPADIAGWYNHAVTFDTDGTDALSGIASCTADQPYSGPDGTGLTVSGSCTDVAGNSTTVASAAFDFDDTDPSVAVLSDRSPDHAGWYNGPVSFTVGGTDNLSGIDACDSSIPYGAPDGSGLTVSGHCTDGAGNVGTGTSSAFDFDATDPTVSVGLDRLPGPNGWFNESTGGPVAQYSCFDATAGIATCPADHPFGDGENQADSGTAVDAAGNTASASIANVDVDLVDPTLAWIGSIGNGASFVFGSVPAAPTCDPSDSLSGPFDCVVTGYGTGVGSHTLTATAHDVAGNAFAESRTYTVQSWTLSGFYQPVDMGFLNTVKAGSTVPLKFEVFAGSAELTTVTSIKGFKATLVNCTAFIDVAADAIEITSTGGTSLRYDSTGGQFIQNWQTPKTPGACYSVAMTTQDNSTLFAHFKLK